MQQITFITSNKGKLEEVKRFLPILVNHIDIDLEEIQSLDLKEIVTYKAKIAYEKLHTPLLVEDTSVIFEALNNKLPGPFIKWFFISLGREGLCKLLDQFSSKKAQAISLFGYYDGYSLQTFEGKIYGQITAYQMTNKGFGWDAIFIPEGATKTLAEMDKEEQEHFSIRK